MTADRLYGVLSRRRAVVVAAVVLVVLAGGVYALGIGVDMSFRPTFSTEASLVEPTEQHDAEFGEAGFRDLVAVVEVGDLHDPDAMAAVADLGDRIAGIDHVAVVREPTTVPMFDRTGAFVPQALRDETGVLLDGDAFAARVDDVLASRQLRRLVIADDGRHVVVTGTIDLPSTAFDERRSTVAEFTSTVDDWSEETGRDVVVTGFPQVEQVYASVITRSVLVVIALLYVVMMAVLFAYFRRVRDVLVCLVGVTAAVPLVLAEMRLLGQPFSIVNSQVLTLVVIVGIAHALHHVEEYRRRREAGVGHTAANRTAFRTIAFASLMTGLTTAAGFLALRTAGMPAVKSFGLSTAAGVATVYLMNWLLVPLLVEVTNRRSPAPREAAGSRLVSRLMALTADAVDRRPRAIVATFVLSLVVLGAWGIPRVSIDQRVNEELPAGHSALAAQQLFEDELSGFLGPEIWLRPTTAGADVIEEPGRLAAFVNRICALEPVRYVGSPLDLAPQPALDAAEPTAACRREPADLSGVRVLATDAAPAGVAPLARTVLGSPEGRDATLVVRLRDVGTAASLPFVADVEQIGREVFGDDVEVVPVGQWWLAQNGMDRLSMDIGFSAVSALAVILPIILVSVRHRRLFVAAILPTVMPVVAALAFMGLAGITMRIGTAMILAISLGLAADDTLYLSTQVKRRLATGSEPASAMHATLRRTGRPACFSSIVLIAGFLAMSTSDLVALHDMGIVAAFTMAYALATDLLLGPAIYRLLERRRALAGAAPVPASRPAEGALPWALHPAT
jgi:predicted RND superfamily exporter protein